LKKHEKALLDNMTGEDALRIIRQLCSADADVRKWVVKEIQRVLVDVDLDEVAEAVLLDLEGICVEDLWDRSGPSSRGYSSPDEMAGKMFEEALQPHEQAIEKYRRLSMSAPCMQYVMGTLKGIYRFANEAKSEFKDWATDIPAETFGFLLKTWRKHAKKPERSRMDKFIVEQCPDWAGWAVKSRKAT